MSWTALPATDCTRATLAQANEVISAINERVADTIGSGALSALGIVPVDADTLATLRDTVETLIPYFHNVDTSYGEAYTKSTIFSVAGLGADWTDPDADFISLKAVHLNELRLVLNQMKWVLVPREGGFTAQKKEAYTAIADRATWADAWASAKTAFAAASWAGYGSYAGAGFNASRTRSGTDYVAHIEQWRLNDATFELPNFTADIIDTRFRIDVTEGATGKTYSNVAMSLFEDVDFAGLPTALQAGEGWQVLDVITDVVKNTTVHYSVTPYPGDPVPDNYEPNFDESAEGAFAQVRPTTAGLLVRLDFEYQ